VTPNRVTWRKLPTTHPLRLTAVFVALAAAAIGASGGWSRLSAGRPSGDAPVRSASAQPVELEAACRQTADWLSRQLGSECHTIVRVPLVIAGDVGQAELDACYTETIAPAAGAMAAEYFDRAAPIEPITILLFAGRESYVHYAWKLFGEAADSSYGYYRPALRTIVVNLGRGRHGLMHELTHALMAFDWPAAPDWLNEGLASLHEDGRVRGDGVGIVGAVNWRLEALQEAIRDGRLRPLSALLDDRRFHGSRQRLNYAQARYFCLYLQDRGLLGRVYRRLRDGGWQAPACFSADPWAALDADFRGWVVQLPESRNQS